jgi:hypothetical protein
MREPCGFEIYNECDGKNCSRDCSRTITIHELPSVTFSHRDLAWSLFVGAVLALAALGIIAGVSQTPERWHAVAVAERGE